MKIFRLKIRHSFPHKKLKCIKKEYQFQKNLKQDLKPKQKNEKINNYRFDPRYERHNKVHAPLKLQYEKYLNKDLQEFQKETKHLKKSPNIYFF